ncbi:MYXO-CTERM sorting domain-containing protein [Nannocystis sp.]|uniref:MYXO-CTERM sorting domain-containing protein n=1 Tax=Nannocystis sp. TaxID=1962667 RepID=UPI0025D66E45|nr:MYXO-CTERM sorting domain-containing protein [Nannocystis sp.]
MPTRLPLPILVLAALVLPASARADEAPPPEDLVCGASKAGDACDFRGGPGTCVADRCSRLDYSKGTPPEVVSHDCLRCQAGAPPAAPAPASQTPASQTPATQAPDPAASQPAKTTSGCRVAPGTPAAPFLLLLLTPLLRRRRSSP